MNNIIVSILENNGIYSYGAVPFSVCLPVNARLYDECEACGMKSVIIFAIPYNTGKTSADGYKISRYARVYDYHRRFEKIFSSLTRDLERAFPDYTFKSFADNSPVNEKLAAAAAGVGVIGKNTLLITKKFGSYVFLGSVITDMKTEYTTIKQSPCAGCGLCAAVCPNGAICEKGLDFEKCLSYISQKKIKTPEDDALLVKNKTVWGCDVCQEVCPMNEGVSLTDDEYFTGSFIKNMSYEFIEAMSDEDFARYPFSWRKKPVILHNLEIVKPDDN